MNQDWDKLRSYVAGRLGKLSERASRHEEAYYNAIDGDAQESIERKWNEAEARADELDKIWNKFFEEGD